MAITYHSGRRIQGIAGVDVAGSFTSSTDAHSAALSLGGGTGSGNTKVGFEVQTGHFLVDKGLKTLTFALDRYNPVSGNGYVAVYDSSGTQKGSNSSTYNLANLTQYPSPVDYTFTWTTPIIIDNGDRIVLEGGTFSSSNQVDLYSRNVSASEAYVNGVYFNSGWTSLSGTDVHFDVTTATNNGDTKPNSVQSGSRWEETDTRKMYIINSAGSNALYEGATNQSTTSGHGTTFFLGDNATYATIFSRITATNHSHPHPAINVDSPNKAFSSSDPWIIELTFAQSYTIPSGTTITYNSYNNGQGARLKYLDFQVYTGSIWENITGTITNPNHSTGDVSSGGWNVKYMTSTTNAEKTGTKFRIRMWDSWDNYVSNGRHYIGGIELDSSDIIGWQEIGI